MAKCKKGKTVSAHLSFEIANAIESRATAMNWSVSKYVGYILQDWYARGCPAINNIEEAMGVPNAIEAKASSFADNLKASVGKGKKKAEK